MVPLKIASPLPPVKCGSPLAPFKDATSLASFERRHSDCAHGAIQMVEGFLHHWRGEVMENEIF